VIIIGEPADEIAEAWRDVSSLAIIWVTLNALVIGILYFVLGRGLDPLASLARGMQSLKGGRYATRIKSPRVTELARITARFNMLALALDGEQAENVRGKVLQGNRPRAGHQLQHGRQGLHAAQE
jgi:two-component system sensor histidine kinase UhpB